MRTTALARWGLTVGSPYLCFCVGHEMGDLGRVLGRGKGTSKVVGLTSGVQFMLRMCSGVCRIVYVPGTLNLSRLDKAAWWTP